jgi:hypothetical protein
LFKLFNGFHALEKLIISRKFNQQNKSIVEPLKSCEKLKYLELSLHLSNGKVFEDIDLYLPNIKTVVIHCDFDLNYDSEIFQNLTKSQSLTKLAINIFHCFGIIDSLIIDVLEIFHKLENYILMTSTSK